MSRPVNVFWFRRDLRLEDNCGLYHALKADLPVLPLFIFDTNILNELKKNDARVTFIHHTLQQIDAELKKNSRGLLVEHGTPAEVFHQLINELDIHAVYTNTDYEPYAKQRDQQIEKQLKEKGIRFKSFKDQVIFEKNEITKDDGDPYTVYTPYMKKWLSSFDKLEQQYYPSEKLTEKFVEKNLREIPSLKELGFEESDIKVPDAILTQSRIGQYNDNRDFPAGEGTTHAGPHLRFGTLSARRLAQKANLGDRSYLKELIWREFFMQILDHFPSVVDRNFKSKYDKLTWINDEQSFEKWCQGRTGYPMVDAGMRQLNESGYMHNRVRMITASFLTKHLLTDWRWGEAYFAEKLLDYELSSNNGNWQWAASTGCDAVPYFRIFNPEEQLKKFDPDLKYVKKWIPEFDTNDYPCPIVGHKEARERALKAYKKAPSG